jgi:hypothetical protein
LRLVAGSGGIHVFDCRPSNDKTCLTADGAVGARVAHGNRATEQMMRRHPLLLAVAALLVRDESRFARNADDFRDARRQDLFSFSLMLGCNSNKRAKCLVTTW